jgi:hypothetical protein
MGTESRPIVPRIKAEYAGIDTSILPKPPKIGDGALPYIAPKIKISIVGKARVKNAAMGSRM